MNLPGGPARASCSRPLPALRNPTIAQLATPGWVAVETIIDEKVVREIIPQLKELGAEGIIEYPLNKVVYIRRLADVRLRPQKSPRLKE